MEKWTGARDGCSESAEDGQMNGTEPEGGMKDEMDGWRGRGDGLRSERKRERGL